MTIGSYFLRSQYTLVSTRFITSPTNTLKMDATLLEPTDTNGALRADPTSIVNGPQQLIHMYLLERSPTYRALRDIRQQVGDLICRYNAANY